MTRKLCDRDGFPVCVRGVIYPSQRAAAAIACGVNEKTVRNHMGAA